MKLTFNSEPRNGVPHMLVITGLKNARFRAGGDIVLSFTDVPKALQWGLDPLSPVSRYDDLLRTWTVLGHGFERVRAE